MKNYNNKTALLLLGWAVIAFVSFTGCEDSENGENDENGESQIWEPYELKAGTSYDYDFEFLENDEITSAGSVNIEAGDPEVTITTTIDGEEITQVYNTSDDLDDNFITGISQTPLAGFLYQPIWLGAFTGQDIETGATWSYSSNEGSVQFEVTGKDTYAGIEGHVIEAVFTDGNSTTTWETCISYDLPLPLMTWVTDDNNNEYIIELTSYSE